MSSSSMLTLSNQTIDLGNKYAIYNIWKKGEFQISWLFQDIDDLGIKSIDDVEEYIKDGKIYGKYLESSERIKDVLEKKALICLNEISDENISNVLVAMQIKNENDLLTVLKHQIQHNHQDTISIIENKNRLEELQNNKENIKQYFKEQGIITDIDLYI